jgi:hypothetical protein
MSKEKEEMQEQAAIGLLQSVHLTTSISFLEKLCQKSGLGSYTDELKTVCNATCDQLLEQLPKSETLPPHAPPQAMSETDMYRETYEQAKIKIGELIDSAKG